MNQHTRLQRHVAAIEAVQTSKVEGPRPSRSYRAARRNLARALRATVGQKITWRTAWGAAQNATRQSFIPAPKPVREPIREAPRPAVEREINRDPPETWLGAPIVKAAIVENHNATKVSKRVRKTKAVIDEVESFPGAGEADPLALKPKKPRASKQTPSGDEVLASFTKAPKAPKKSAAKPAAPKAAKAAAAPRKRAPAAKRKAV